MRDETSKCTEDVHIVINSCVYGWYKTQGVWGQSKHKYLNTII